VDADLERDLYYGLLWNLEEGGPGHIAALGRRLFWKVSYHHVRAVLLRLEREGLVTSERRHVLGDGAVIVRQFALTDGGRQIVRDLDATFGPRELLPARS